jgi:precorrin-4 methylase
MGVGNPRMIRRNLLGAGRKSETPIVIVENGTRDNERAVATTLQDLTQCVDELAISGPAMIFVGLDWLDAGLQRPDAVIVYSRQADVDRHSAAKQEATGLEVFL